MNPGIDEDMSCHMYCCLCFVGGCCMALRPNFCLTCYTYPVRAQIRAKFNLPAECCGFPWCDFSCCGALADVATLVVCGNCAECQMTYELYARGLLRMPEDGSWPYPTFKETAESQHLLDDRGNMDTGNANTPPGTQGEGQPPPPPPQDPVATPSGPL
eukprot:TRINITY_DN14577_c0_g1_i1.p1 TRINITY_DN14577_c0_g1~~TRINITY_DN14577_c0_g1_i1.p1  ORF type:complete len:158 (-),score=11.47 TRINITY_DN14577_c0_g1_i1:193-666(-)